MAVRVSAAALDDEVKSLIMRYVTGKLEERQFLTAYRRLMRLRSLFNR
ncbi:MAG TPA: hypothetical protein GXX47_09310 [Firmicutes bacterium]|nr:hypothetical protein [Bacillota bacterium]